MSKVNHSKPKVTEIFIKLLKQNKEMSSSCLSGGYAAAQAEYKCDHRPLVRNTLISIKMMRILATCYLLTAEIEK